MECVLFFTRDQLERKTIHNAHRIRLKLEFNKCYIDQFLGIGKTDSGFRSRLNIAY